TVSALGLSVFPVHAYLLNRAQVRDAQAELASAMDYRASTQAGPVPLSVLEPLRIRLETLTRWNTEDPPWAHRMGLYAGNELLPHLRTYYTSTLRAVLI